MDKHRAWFPNQFAKVQPVQREIQGFLNSQHLHDRANWASSSWSQNTEVLTRAGNNTVWDTVLVLCTQDYRLGYDKVILSALEAMSLGLFPKLMVSHNLSLKGLVGTFTRAASFLEELLTMPGEVLLCDSRNLSPFSWRWKDPKQTSLLSQKETI